jgi:hypothetical protein
MGPLIILMKSSNFVVEDVKVGKNSAAKQMPLQLGLHVISPLAPAMESSPAAGSSPSFIVRATALVSAGLIPNSPQVAPKLVSRRFLLAPTERGSLSTLAST